MAVMIRIFNTILYLIILLLCLFNCAFAQGQWSTPVLISEPAAGYYPQIIAQGDTLHVAYENGRTYDKICYIRSTDAGITWSEYRVLSERDGETYSPYIMRWSQRLMAVWLCYFSHGVYRLNIGYSISNNNGLTWSSPQYVFNPNRPDPFALSASAADSLVSIVIADSPGDTMIFYAINSTDFGQSWSQPQQMFRASYSGMPDCASFQNAVHFSWNGHFDWNHRSEIYYCRSDDGGINWSSNIALSDTDQFHSQLPAITVNQGGNPLIIWMDYKNSPYFDSGDIFLRTSPDSGNFWMDEVQVTDNHRAWRSDIEISGDTIVIVWEDNRPENGWRSTYCVMSLDGGQTWNEPDWVDGTEDDSWNPALALSNGKVYVVWYEQRFPPDTSGLFFSCWRQIPDVIEDGGEQAFPDEISLLAHPNPFNSSVTISINSEKEGELAIYNSLGQLIKSFQMENGGSNRIVWDATDDNGSNIASGTYLATFQSGSYSRRLKLVYVK
jgi:hypothetical protein